MSWHKNATVLLTKVLPPERHIQQVPYLSTLFTGKQ